MSENKEFEEWKRRQDIIRDYSPAFITSINGVKVTDDDILRIGYEAGQKAEHLRLNKLIEEAARL